MKAADLPQYYNAVDILERNLELRGHKTAILSEARSMTFHEVSDQVNQIGNALKAADIRFGDCVGILAPDRVEWVTSFFAIAKIGGIALGMNTLLKSMDFDHIFRDSRVRLLIVDESLLELIEPVRDKHPTLEKVIVLGAAARSGDVEFDDWLKGQSIELEAESTHRDDYCSLHYSSGTTGPPKGVLHAHKDYPLIAQNTGINLLGIDESDRVFSVAKLFFVYGIGANLVFAWYAGASCVLYPGSPRQAAGVLKTIDSFSPTILVSVPTVYNAMLAMRNFYERYDISSVRMCLSAGEALPIPVWESWRNATGLEILDTIGCTETYHTFLANRPGDLRPGSSGKPSPGYEVRLVDDDGQDIQPGEIGHLMVKGESVALSYLHQYEKSQHTFRGEWLFTGDRYRMDEDGFYWHCGRGDDMLKIGGLWVSPIEIENVLASHEEVSECAVVGARDQGGLIKPKAFVCTNATAGDKDAMTVELARLCADSLEVHKRPRWFEFIDELPRTATGKIQRFRLYEEQ